MSYKAKPPRRGHNGSCNYSNEGRYPPHLRGRAIGMFYAHRSRGRQRRNALVNPRKSKKLIPHTLGTIRLSETNIKQIQTILDNPKYVGEDNLQFHKQFQKVVKGTMEERLTCENGFIQNLVIDAQLFIDFDQQKQTERYKHMLMFRQKLPSYQRKEEIINLIHNNSVVVISGETGCGKTTQVPQFILDDFIENKKGSICNILCTQPRRISAITIAERVADERGEALGYSTGYKIRVEHQLPRSKGSITYCTTGILLKYLERDPNLKGISHVILDEIHERTTESDLSITILKQVLNKRKDLKLVLMSATLNAEKFSKYYNDCPHINIPGLTFPVQEFYLEDVLQRTGFMGNPYERPRKKQKQDEYPELLPTYVRELEASGKYSSNVCHQLKHPLIEDTNLELILALIINICETEKDKGAILVFLTGYAEISKLISFMEGSGKFPQNKYLILPLHSIMPTLNQRKVFERPPTGIQKIIISTNIAETSITIDDIVFVIDCGKIKISNYDADSNTTTLRPEWIALANASQRKGRAGRVQPGICFHLYTKVRNTVLPEYPLPEILRSRIENTILTTKVLQLGDATAFLTKLMDCPKIEIITTSVNLLKRLEALDQDENLTPLGYHLARLPMGPQMGKMILLAAIFSCVDPVLSIAASLDYRDAFMSPMGMEREVDAKKLELADGCKSDHLLFYKAISQYENSNSPYQFAREYFLNQQTLNQIVDIKKQLMEYLCDMEFVNTKDPNDATFNINSQNMSLVKAIICAGLYPNVSTVRYVSNGNAGVEIETKQKVVMHPKSVLFKETYFESQLIVYYLKLYSTMNFVHDATMIHPLPLIFFGDNYNFKTAFITIGTNVLRFRCSRSKHLLIKGLKDQLNLFFENKVLNLGFVNWAEDSIEVQMLRAVMELITNEDTGEIEYKNTYY